jgi:hypothetical protein
MLALILVLLAVWLVCVIVGFAVKALLWLAILGLVAFVVTSVLGMVHHAASKPK